jgi:hypothetical protein
MGDMAALKELLSDNFVGMNLHGLNIDKDAFIANSCNPDLKFSMLEVSEQLVKQIDAVGIVIGKTIYQATFKGKPIEGCTRFIDIWASYNDRTLLVSSTVIREKSPGI